MQLNIIESTNSTNIKWRHHSWAGLHHWPGLGGAVVVWESCMVNITCRLAGRCAQVWSPGWTAPTGAGLRILDTATGSGTLGSYHTLTSLCI